MSKLISVNIQNLENLGQSFSHNLRFKSPSYLIDESDKNINFSYVEDLATFTKKSDFEDYQIELTAKIKADYLLHNKQKMQEKTILFKEAVISFGREQFKNCDVNKVNDCLKKFITDFEDKYKVKVLSHSLHLDEGHVNDKGEKEHNYHCHFQIVNYDIETHRTGMRKVNYSNLQTELFKAFEPLGFERGRDYRQEQKKEAQTAAKEGRNAIKIDKPLHLPHYKYKSLKTAKNDIEKKKLEDDIKNLKLEFDKLQQNIIDTNTKQQEQDKKYQNLVKDRKKEFDKYDNLLDETIQDLKSVEKTKEKLTVDLAEKQQEYDKLIKKMDIVNKKMTHQQKAIYSSLKRKDTDLEIS